MDKHKDTICDLMRRGLWDEDLTGDDYDAAREVYEEVCLDGLPLHAIECPECDGKKGYFDCSWSDEDYDEICYDVPCDRCKGRGVIRVEDETEEEGRRRAEKERPKATGYRLHNGGIYDGKRRVVVEYVDDIFNRYTTFYGESYEEAAALANEWIQAALSKAAAGTQPVSPPSATTSTQSPLRAAT